MAGLVAAIALVASACAADEADDVGAPDDESDDVGAPDDESEVVEEEAEDIDFPTRRIEFVIPWGAGGGTDQIGRQLANSAEEECGWNIVVTNMEGANGTIGHRHVAEAEPDGHTVLSADSTLNTYIHTDLADLGPDDLQGVMRHNDKFTVVAVNADLPYETIEEFLEAAETEDLSLAVTPPGGGNHSAAAGMAIEAGVDFTFIPYDGGAVEIVQGTLSGEADAAVADDAELLPHIESGDLRPLAIMTDERSSILPDTPTLKESGVDWSFSQWRGIAVPSETPEPVVDALHDCFSQALESESFIEFMESQGFPISYLGPAEEFDAFMDEDFVRTGELLEALEAEGLDE